MLDAQVQQLVDLYYSMDLPEFNSESSAEEVRELMTRFSKKSLTPEVSTCKIREQKVATSFGEVKIREYYPQSKQDLAPILFFRGSGFVVNNLEDSDHFCIRLAEKTNTFVISVDYPLAPEYPFPSSIEACYQVYQWIVEHVEFLGLEPSKMVAIGESSGGCLLASLTQMLRDRAQAQLGYQVLLYPITDYDLDSTSYLKLNEGYILTRKKMQWYLEQYLGNTNNSKELYAFPVNAQDFSHLPKTCIMTAEFDPLLDDGLKYANLLKEAGVDCEYICFGGLIHGFMKFSTVKRSGEAFEALSSRIQSFLN